MHETPPPPPPPPPGPPPPPSNTPASWSASSESLRSANPPQVPPPNRLKKFFAPLGMVGILLWKFLGPVLKFAKFLPAVLKTGGTMLLSIGIYAMQWGWKFAVGFVLLMFIHECGHILAARRFGLKVSAPMFIPFVGALILLKDSTRNAWVEAWVGISGPLLGTFGAACCHLVYLWTGEAFYGGLAFTGYFLNLFNLAPIGFLDGGRIVTAISPWLWILGAVCLTALLFLHFNIIVLLILLMSLPRLLSLFRKKSEAERRYFEIPPWQRVVMSLMYFGLIVALLFGIRMTHVNPRATQSSQPDVQVVG